MIDERRAKRYCKDDISKIENYEQAINDHTQTWDCHHRLEISINNETLHDTDSLKRIGMYYHRPYFELIFLIRKEHKKLHQSTNYARQKNREGQLKFDRKGDKNPMSAKYKEEKRKTNPDFGKKKPYKHSSMSYEGNEVIKHFNLNERTRESEKLYKKEVSFYRKYKRFSWE